MDVKEAYNNWASQYDSNDNRTRDLEAVSLRQTLKDLSFKNCLEIGCGTGKNTEWLHNKATSVTAIDFSEKMLSKARKKITSTNVQFLERDITQNWKLADHQFDLVTFSLVLEHIELLDPIFQKIAHYICSGGYVYIGELHPYKQYAGSKARYETEDGVQTINCYNHHLSDFTQLAIKHGFHILDINEFFDNNVKVAIPRILTILLVKSE